MAEGRRMSRLGVQIQEEVSDIIHRKLKDPRLGFVSVTGARVTADLQFAHIYISVMGSADDVSKNLDCLDKAARFIRTELAKRLRIKHIPELHFYHDDSSERGARIDSIIKHLKEENDGTDLPGSD